MVAVSLVFPSKTLYEKNPREPKERLSRSGLLISQERVTLGRDDGQPPLFSVQGVRSRHLFVELADRLL
ncbi:hypothetical protein [Candidatus Methylacidithermus pantelleriae]|uniref:hypothetical protein n=1 Tax=Candidatus Methylacidithermus pantelleriae TaxID=2744239 RepID=UPI00157C5F67|nr:hypothetical protein [Candidatus Methylacidithermus pantelleriae]